MLSPLLLVDLHTLRPHRQNLSALRTPCLADGGARRFFRRVSISRRIAFDLVTLWSVESLIFIFPPNLPRLCDLATHSSKKGFRGLIPENLTNMAEILGIISSVITVVEVAGKIGPKMIALKRLWDDVQDIPQIIHDQMEQIEILCPILDDIEVEFSKTREILQNDTMAQKSFEYCRRAVSELESLTERLQQQITCAKKRKRMVAKFRVALKKHLIEEHHRKLNNALWLLTLSQTTY